PLLATVRCTIKADKTMKASSTSECKSTIENHGKRHLRLIFLFRWGKKSGDSLVWTCGPFSVVLGPQVHKACRLRAHAWRAAIPSLKPAHEMVGSMDRDTWVSLGALLGALLSVGAVLVGYIRASMRNLRNELKDKFRRENEILRQHVNHGFARIDERLNMLEQRTYDIKPTGT